MIRQIPTLPRLGNITIASAHRSSRALRRSAIHDDEEVAKSDDMPLAPSRSTVYPPSRRPIRKAPRQSWTPSKSVSMRSIFAPDKLLDGGSGRRLHRAHIRALHSTMLDMPARCRPQHYADRRRQASAKAIAQVEGGQIAGGRSTQAGHDGIASMLRDSSSRTAIQDAFRMQPGDDRQGRRKRAAPASPATQRIARRCLRCRFSLKTREEVSLSPAMTAISRYELAGHPVRESHTFTPLKDEGS